MQIEIASPACLLLGLVYSSDGVRQLGITLQHPPLHIAARPAVDLWVSGARADFAYQRAEQCLAQLGLPQQAGIEIEVATPAHMGLASDAMLTQSVWRALAQLHGSDLGKIPAINAAHDLVPTHAFERGGLLLVDCDGGCSNAARFCTIPRTLRGYLFWFYPIRLMRRRTRLKPRCTRRCSRWPPT